MECNLGSVGTYRLKGNTPVSVRFGSERTVELKTWKKAVEVILKDCNNNPDTHERLMDIRDEVYGRNRVILSASPEKMKVPIKIDEGLYFEAKFDTETLMYVLRDRVLKVVGYDTCGVVIRYRLK